MAESLYLEQSLDTLDAQLPHLLAQVQKATALARSLKRPLAEGEVAKIRQVLEALTTPLAEAQRVAQSMAEVEIDETSDLRSGQWLKQLTAELARAGVAIKDPTETRIFCYPHWIRVTGGEGEPSVMIGKKVTRKLRIAPLVRRLEQENRKEPRSGTSRRFLEQLYKGWQLIQRPEPKDGTLVLLSDIYEVLALNPEGRRYPIEDFALSLLQLDRHPDLRTSDNKQFEYTNSSGARGGKGIRIHDQLGELRTYVGIRFS